MDGYIQLRRGLYPHIKHGRMTLDELAVYIYLQFIADFCTGRCETSAPHVYYETGRKMPLRKIQRLLESLEKKGYIRRFIIDSKGDYFLLIHKFQPTLGAFTGKYLNAFKSKSSHDLVFEDSVQDDAQDDAHGDVQSDAQTGGQTGDYVKKSSKNSNKNSKENSKEKSESSLSPSPLVDESISTREIAEILGIEDTGAAMNGDADKAKEFAIWMIERFPTKKDGTPRIATMRDFLHHWNNESGSDNGFRLQFETFQKLIKKQQEIPLSEWEWICRAPACSRPWTQDLNGIKLCARCYAAFPDHPAEKEVKWVHPCAAGWTDVNGHHYCGQKATEQAGVYWICPEHIDEIRQQFEPQEEEEAVEVIPYPQRELTTVDEL